MVKETIIQTHITVIRIVSSLFGIFFGISFGLYLRDVIIYLSLLNSSAHQPTGLLKLLYSFFGPYGSNALIIVFSALWTAWFIYYLFCWQWSIKDIRFIGQYMVVRPESYVPFLAMIVIFLVGVLFGQLFFEVCTVSAWYAFSLLIMWFVIVHMSIRYVEYEERMRSEEEKLRKEEIEGIK